MQDVRANALGVTARDNQLDRSLRAEFDSESQCHRPIAGRHRKYSPTIEVWWEASAWSSLMAGASAQSTADKQLATGEEIFIVSVRPGDVLDPLVRANRPPSPRLKHHWTSPRHSTRNTGVSVLTTCYFNS